MLFLVHMIHGLSDAIGYDNLAFATLPNVLVKQQTLLNPESSLLCPLLTGWRLEEFSFWHHVDLSKEQLTTQQLALAEWTRVVLAWAETENTVFQDRISEDRPLLSVTMLTAIGRCSPVQTGTRATHAAHDGMQGWLRAVVPAAAAHHRWRFRWDVP